MILSLFTDADPSIDYMDRMDVYMSNEPSGASYRNIVHYGQLCNQLKPAFMRYDYESAKENKKHYGQATPPEYDLKKLDFPIAMFSGSQDLLADPRDVAWTNEQLKDTVIFKHEYYMGHMSFAIGKDMSFFTVDVMSILNHYNNKCSVETINSKFEIGNEKCKNLLLIQ